MKGIVFTEFLKMVEQKYGYETVDQLILSNELPSGGAYTSIGTYDHSEMIKLLISLSERSKETIPDLLKTFGLYFFDVLESNYPQFLEAASSAFDFLASIETYIHVEVRKLYPDAELPTFQTHLDSEQRLEMVYHSERKMADFAEGLIEKSLLYFNENCRIDRYSISEDDTNVRFVITKQ